MIAATNCSSDSRVCSGGDFPWGHSFALWFWDIHDLTASSFLIRVGFGLGVSVAVAGALVVAGVSVVTEVLAMAGDLPDVGVAAFFCSVESQDGS